MDSLVTEYQICNDKKNLNPLNNYTEWEKCLNNVYAARSPKPTLAENASAIHQIWGKELTRTLFIKALHGIGPGAYELPAIYTETNNFYPITITVNVDADATISTGNTHVTVTDNNNDPQQGSIELKVLCKVGNTLIWRAHSRDNSKPIHLTKFIRNMDPGTVNLFSAGFPQKQNDGSWQGVIQYAGLECYRFEFTIGDSSKVYTWDPYIQASA